MARASKPGVAAKSAGDQFTAAECNAFDTAHDDVIDDYLSQTETTEQAVVSTVNIGTKELKRTLTADTLGVGVTTIAAVGEVMVITGDGGANTVATITGGETGQKLTLFFVDGFVTITDTDAHTANTVDLAGNATDLVSADDTTLTIMFDGTSWYEIGRSVNS
jgi:hypothetical protein